MQGTSKLYRELFAAGADVEKRLAIGETGVLIDRQGSGITFGGTRILVASSGADGGYDESIVDTVETKSDVFPDGGPGVGGTQAAQIDVDMYAPAGEIPRKARLAPFIRLTDGVRHSEWVPQGVFFVDTREDVEQNGLRRIKLHGYDGMLAAEQAYPSSKLDWPALDIQAAEEIANAMGVPVDPRTWDAMTAGYRIPYPADYSCREVLGYLASMYAGNFVMSDDGALLLIPLWSLPAETRLLVSEDRQTITFGGVRILV